jgi:hypothetical protein
MRLTIPHDSGSYVLTCLTLKGVLAVHNRPGQRTIPCPGCPDVGRPLTPTPRRAARSIAQTAQRSTTLAVPRRRTLRAATSTASHVSAARPRYFRCAHGQAPRASPTLAKLTAAVGKQRWFIQSPLPIVGDHRDQAVPGKKGASALVARLQEPHAVP